MSFLGISFGKKTQRGTSLTNMDRTESTVQNGTSSTATNTASNSTTSGTSSGVTNSTQSGTSSTTGSQNTTSQSVSQSLSDQLLGRLENSVGGLLNNVNAGPTSISDFNKNQFVAQGMQAARASAQSNLDQALGGLIDSTGGKSNSMVALLSNRLNNDTNASLAGTQAQLTGQAEEIARNNISAADSRYSTGANVLNSLLSQMVAGRTSQTGSQATTTAQNTTQSQTGSETNNQSQSQTTAATQQSIVDAIQSLFGSTNTRGSESVATTGRMSGGGMSLSI